MTKTPVRNLWSSLLPPVMALLVVVYAVPQWGELLYFYVDLHSWQSLAVALTVLGMLFATLFGQWRILAAIALVATAFLTLQHAPDAADANRRVLAVLLPLLGLAAVGLSPERGPYGVAPAVAAGVIVVTVLFATHGIPGIEASMLAAPALRVGPMQADLYLVVAAVTAAAMLLRQFRRPSATGGAVLAAMVCLLPLAVDASSRPDLLAHTSAAVAALWAGVVGNVWRLAFVDELTRLPNRRALEYRLRRRRSAVAMVDVDSFKQFNDTWGHQAGDQVLRRVASLLASAGRGVKVYRYGGEEFAIVLNIDHPERAANVLERLRRRLMGQPFTLRNRLHDREHRGSGGGTTVMITASFGLAMARPGETPLQTLRRADTALYRAKRRGRNQVETCV